MASQAEALYALQKIDIRIIKNTARIKEIDSALEDSQIVADARLELENAQEVIKPLQKKQCELEHEIQTNTQKAKATEDRLYSGSVKNPKELQDMQAEIASLKNRNTQTEEHLLEVMVEVEAAEEVISKSEAALQQITTDWEHEHGDLLEEKARLQSDSEAARGARSQTTQVISADNLKLYNAMRPKKGNQPMAALQNGICSMCGVEQTSTVQQEVRRNQTLVNCINCGRILADVN